MKKTLYEEDTKWRGEYMEKRPHGEVKGDTYREGTYMDTKRKPHGERKRGETNIEMGLHAEETTKKGRDTYRRVNKFGEGIQENTHVNHQ